MTRCSSKLQGRHVTLLVCRNVLNRCHGSLRASVGPLALSALTYTPALTYPSNNFDTVDCTEVIGKAVGKVPSAGRSGTQLPSVQSSCAMMYKKLHRHISFTTARSIYLAFADTVIAPKVKRLSGACLRRQPTRPTPR